MSTWSTLLWTVSKAHVVVCTSLCTVTKCYYHQLLHEIIFCVADFQSWTIHCFYSYLLGLTVPRYFIVRMALRFSPNLSKTVCLLHWKCSFQTVIGSCLTIILTIVDTVIHVPLCILNLSFSLVLFLLVFSEEPGGWRWQWLSVSPQLPWLLDKAHVLDHQSPHHPGTVFNCPWLPARQLQEMFHPHLHDVHRLDRSFFISDGVDDNGYR